MRNYIFGLVTGLAIVGSASANSFYAGRNPDIQVPGIVAGEINSVGVPVKGNGFTSSQLGVGRYEIRFNNNSLRGCAALIANVDDLYSYPDAAAIAQVSCSRKFDVTIGNDETGFRNEGFSFIAVQE